MWLLVKIIVVALPAKLLDLYQIDNFKSSEVQQL